MPYTVVLFGSQCEEYPDMLCPMNALGPFETRGEAETVAGEYLRSESSAWTKPHVLTLDSEL